MKTQIVLATCHSSGGRQLYNQDFDVVIIDEATQALEAVRTLLLKNSLFSFYSPRSAGSLYLRGRN